MFATMQDVEEWFDRSIEASREMAEPVFRVSEAAWVYLSDTAHRELKRCGNPDLNIKNLGRFTSKPPPPPPPKGLIAKSSDWCAEHKRAVSIVAGAFVLGIGTRSAYTSGYLYLPGLGYHKQSPKSKKASSRTPMIRNGVRKEAVLVLGGDTPLGRAIALHLCSIGYIVIVSVSSKSSLTVFNSLIPPSSRGYIKAVLFDTTDVETSISSFVRSVDEVLKLRFPLLTAGDPYAAPGDDVFLVAAINALSFVAPSAETLSPTATSAAAASPSFQGSTTDFRDAVQRSVIGPLAALSSLQPLLTAPLPRGVASSSGSSSSDTPSEIPSATMISILSSPSSHTSLPGTGQESVIAQATLAGMEVLRREAEDRGGREKPFTLSGLPSRHLSGISARRNLRVSTLEVDEGLTWGYAVGLPSPGPVETEGSSDAGPAGAGAGSTSSLPPRPGMGPRSRSLSASSWQSRDTATQVVLSKIDAMLLTCNPNKRLRAFYRVYLPTEKDKTVAGRLHASFIKGTHNFMRVVPTSWVDVMLALRRNVSLRRAGFISQGPRGTAARSLSQGAYPSPSSSMRASGSLNDSTESTGTEQRRAAVRAARLSGLSASRSFSSRARAVPPIDRKTEPLTQSGILEGVSSDDGEHLSGVSRPPSLPDSNSGDSASRADMDDGMLSSGILSADSASNDGRAPRAASPSAVRSRSREQRDLRTSDSAQDSGPWMGPSTPNLPTSSSDSNAAAPAAPAAASPAEVHGSTAPLHASSSSSSSSATASSQHDVASVPSNPGSAVPGSGQSAVGDSWIRLGESSAQLDPLHPPPSSSSFVSSTVRPAQSTSKKGAEEEEEDDDDEA